MEMVIIVVAAVSGLFLLGAYRLGLKEGMRIASGKSIERKAMSGKKKSDSMIDARTEAVLRNIERYDGTSTGQQQIN